LHEFLEYLSVHGYSKDTIEAYCLDLMLFFQFIEKYFPEESDRCCYPTEYAISQNVYDRYKEEYKNGSAAWGLRNAVETPNGTQLNKSSMTITKEGKFSHSDISFGIGVRPVLWIDLGE